MDSVFWFPLEQEEQHYACNTAMQEIMDGLVPCIHQVQLRLLVYVSGTDTGIAAQNRGSGI